MPQGMTGVTAASADRFVLDVGQVFINIDITALESATPGMESTNWADAIADAQFIGATRNGATFNINRTLRQIPVDGQLGPTKGFIRRASVAPTLQVNVMEHTIENYKRTIAGIVTSAVGETGEQYTKIAGGPILAATYIDNVAIASTYTGSDRPIILVLHNVMAHTAPEFTLADEDEAVLPVTFNAHIDPANPYVEPWNIYHPVVTV